MAPEAGSFPLSWFRPFQQHSELIEINPSFCAPVQFGLKTTGLGRVLAAWTPLGVCALRFLHPHKSLSEVYLDLQQAFPKSRIQENTQESDEIFGKIANEDDKEALTLHVKGTPFQLSVWRSLLKIPAGQRRTYSEVAESVGRPNAVRAVGSAIGNNPVAVVIPCHRVLRKDGEPGGYRWGLEIKQALLELEKGLQPLKPTVNGWMNSFVN